MKYLPEAVRIVVEANLGSTSLLQRKLLIGYNQANRLMEQLEKLGVLGSNKGASPRKVLINIKDMDTVCKNIAKATNEE